MVQQVFGRDTDTGECGWFIPVADAPDVYITGLTIVGDVITAERSDGAIFPVTVTHPLETDGVHINGAIAPVIDLIAKTITYATINDLDESAGPDLVQDISALMTALTSSPHPDVVGSGDISVNFVGGEWVVTSTAHTVDTDTWSVFTTNPDGSTLVTEVDVNGPTGSTHTIAASTDTFGNVIVAPAAGTATNDEDYLAGDLIIEFPNGETWAMPRQRDYCGDRLVKNQRVMSRTDFAARNVFIRERFGLGTFAFADHTVAGVSTENAGTLSFFVPNNSCEPINMEFDVNLHADITVETADVDKFGLEVGGDLGSLHHFTSSNEYNRNDAYNRTGRILVIPLGGLTVNLTYNTFANIGAGATLGADGLVSSSSIEIAGRSFETQL